MAPTLKEEFRRLKKLKVEELRQCETDSRSIKHSSQDKLADVRPAQRSPRRNEWYKRRNREKSTSKRDCDDMKSKNKGIFSRKKARNQRPDVVSDIIKGVEDNIVPNLQAAVTNKLVVPSLPLAKRTTFPIKKPTPANLKNAEIIDLMSSDDELDHVTPLLSSIRRKGNTNKPLPSIEKGGYKHIVGKSSGGLNLNVSRAMSVMRAIDEVDSATNSEAEEDSPVRPVKGIVHEANIDTSTFDESISVEKDDAQENVESIEIDPNSAICWSCYVPLGNEASNGSFSNSAFVHSHPLLE